MTRAGSAVQTRRKTGEILCENGRQPDTSDFQSFPALRESILEGHIEQESKYKNGSD